MTIVNVEGFDDLISHYEFCATMGPRTPLRWLRMHKAKAKTRAECEECDPAFGIWIPACKSWEDLGLPPVRFSPSTMASSWGEIPDDGGDVLPYLIARQEILIRSEPAPTKVAKWIDLMERESRFRRLYAKPGQLDSLDGALALGLFESVGLEAVPPPIAERLWLAGFQTPQQIVAASDGDLKSVTNGLGPARLSALRRAAAAQVQRACQPQPPPLPSASPHGRSTAP